MIVATNM